MAGYDLHVSSVGDWAIGVWQSWACWREWVGPRKGGSAVAKCGPAWLAGWAWLAGLDHAEAGPADPFEEEPAFQASLFGQSSVFLLPVTAKMLALPAGTRFIAIGWFLENNPNCMNMSTGCNVPMERRALADRCEGSAKTCFCWIHLTWSGAPVGLAGALGVARPVQAMYPALHFFFAGPGTARPSLNPHFIDTPWACPTLHFYIDRLWPSWPCPTPHFFWPTPHFYWPARSLASI